MKKLSYIILGCILTALGIIILRHSHLITGGTAGLSLNLSYFFHFPFAFIFFVINLPFYLFSIIQMGLRFTLMTLFSVFLLSVITWFDAFLPGFTIPLLFGAVIGGLFIGFGLTLLFKNGASLGGANILALFLQRKYGWNPGKVNLLFDMVVVCSGMYTVGFSNGLSSILSIVTTSIVISCFKHQISSGNAQRKPVIQPGVTTMQN
ncbi:YitT family protein [Bacillus gobiensis]|uniref:YitT family protein n=1 Tax=Bacillus gobiensis TaxID=1441095 RepID=UPI003D1BD125